MAPRVPSDGTAKGSGGLDVRSAPEQSAHQGCVGCTRLDAWPEAGHAAGMFAQLIRFRQGLARRNA